MKDLSIEEKAKRYDEAIERAKNYYSTTDSASDIKLIGLIFPELKESGDDRIKKKIIATILLYYGEPLEDEAKEMIAWLEKQGDKVSAIEVFETEFERQVSGLIASAINKEHEYNQDYVKWTANALLNYAKHELDKQGEQKPDTDFSDLRTWKYIVDAVLTEKELIGQYRDRPFTEEVAKKLQKRFGNIEQKPAWSEEDEEIKNELIRHFESLTQCIATEERHKENRRWLNWLKSLKDRVQPQSQWKPSDEQMVTLEYYMHTLVCNSHKETLFSLYQDLKKLSEE